MRKNWDKVAEAQFNSLDIAIQAEWQDLRDRTSHNSL